MRSYKVAVTGGIGSGKSVVCDIIKELGFKVFSCDEIYDDLLLNDDFVRGACDAAGVEPIEEGGKISLDRKAVSQKVFSNEQARARLEAFTHPEIMRELTSRMDGAGGLCFAEVPLLFEGKFETLFDEIIVVLRGFRDRIEAIVERDGLSEEEIISRMKSQVDHERIAGKAHTVIRNDCAPEALRERIEIALEKIIEKANRNS